MKKIIVKHWSILIIFLLVGIFSFPYWAKGMVPFPADYLVNAFPPWQYYFGLPVKNNAMPDVVTQMYPWKHLVMSFWESGQLPLWNPYNFSGNPLLANYQSAVFHPLNLLFFVLPEITAWSLMIIFQPLLAGLFTYLFCCELRLSKAASLLSSGAFMFAGFITVWMAYGTLSYALLWLPLALYAIEKSFNGKSTFSFPLLSLALTASLFSGHFQTSLYVILASSAFLVFKLASTRHVKTFLICGLFFILGILLALIQIFPTFELHQFSVRSQSYGVSEVIPWEYLPTIIAPDFYGNAVTRNDWFGHYAEWSSFFGTIPLFLALFALVSKKKSYVWFFGFLGISSLILTQQTPILDLIIRLKVPILSTSAASRIIGIFSFSGAVLAGFGFDKLREDLEKKQFRQVFITGALGIIVFTTIWWVLLIKKPFTLEQLQIAKRNFTLSTVMLVAFLILIVGCWSIQKIFKNKKVIVHNSLFIVLMIILALSLFDPLRFAQKWMPFDDPKNVYPTLPVLEFLPKTIGPNRLFGYFGMEMQNYYRIQSFNGYDPLYIERYGELIMAANDGRIRKPSTRGSWLERREPYTMKLLNLMGGQYVLHAIPDDHHVWAFNFWDYPGQFKQIYHDDKYEVYENLGVFPRAFLAYDYKVVKEPQEIINQMFAKKTDLRKTLILEEAPGLKVTSGSGSVEIINYEPNKIELLVKTDQPGFLFLSDNYYPGWKAFVNGKETKIYRADYTFRAVEIPEDGSRVEFIYDPQSFRFGMYASLVGLFGMVGGYLLLKRRGVSR